MMIEIVLIYFICQSTIGQKKNSMINKWREGLYPTPNCFDLICPNIVMNTLLTIPYQNMLIGRANVK